VEKAMLLNKPVRADDLLDAVRDKVDLRREARR
jgi:hypothetical protein